MKFLPIHPEEIKRRLRPAMDDYTPLPVIITIQNAWFLINALRLAARHPHLHKPLTRQFKEIAQAFQDAIVARYPNTKLAFQPGIGMGSFMRRAA